MSGKSIDLTYQEALDLFSLQDIYQSDCNISLWQEELEATYKKFIGKYHPNYYIGSEPKERVVIKYQMIVKAYTILSNSLKRSNNQVREKFENIQHDTMFNGILPGSFNPKTYTRDTSRPDIAVPDFLTNQKDFNEVFDYNMQKLKSMDTTIKVNSYDSNDVFSRYTGKANQEDYTPIFKDIDFKFENKKLKTNPNAFKTKSLKDIQREREEFDREFGQ